MKKIIISILCLSIIIIPLNTHATTLKEYENAVAKYTKELKDHQANLAKSKEEVAQVKANISKIEGQIKDAEEQIESLQKEIDDSNKKIKQKTKESKKIIEYYQISNGENSYLEYIFGATSITDMIYRMSVVEQLTEYNDNLMKELNQLIKKNEKQQVELKSKKEELTKLQQDLEKEKARIEIEIKDTEGIIPSVEGQIKMYQSRVSYYKSKGCKSSDVIGVTCDVPKKTTSGSGVQPGQSATGFRFPTDGGGLSRGYGNGHKGLDITGYLGKPVYAAAAGTVYYAGSDLDRNHAIMVMIVHNVNGRLVFTQYAHLQSYNVYVGQEVTTNTVIGKMGNTGYVLPRPSSSCPACGTHLHFEVTEDRAWGYNANYNVHSAHVVNPYKYLP